jgi:hypothetical protein
MIIHQYHCIHLYTCPALIGAKLLENSQMVNASGLAGKPEPHLGIGGNGGIYILNQLPGWNQGFTVHCYASGNDQGWHNISPHVVYEFHFQIHDVWDSMFTCNFICPSLGNTATFQAYGPDVAHVNQCVNCLWMVRTDGFYLQSRSQAPGQGTFMHRWGYQE